MVKPRLVMWQIQEKKLVKIQSFRVQIQYYFKIQSYFFWYKLIWPEMQKCLVANFLLYFSRTKYIFFHNTTCLKVGKISISWISENWDIKKSAGISWSRSLHASWCHVSFIWMRVWSVDLTQFYDVKSLISCHKQARPYKLIWLTQVCRCLLFQIGRTTHHSTHKYTFI